MPYPSILTIWDGQEESQGAFDLAVDLARQWSSHLDIACLGVDRAPTGFYAADFSAEALDFFGQAKDEAESLAKQARCMLDEDDLHCTVRPAAMRFNELPVIVGKAAWFQDLTVLSQPFGRQDEELPEAVIDAALFNAPTPVLVVPKNAAKPIGKRILVAWNGSMEAARALRAALPLMKEAETVEAVIIDPDESRSGAADPGAALGAMLSRHRINAEIALLPQTEATVAETLRVRADETDADMIVMGAYGHSRMRERFLGGATRDMLKTADRPILFAR
ncbi:MAG: universal stress protein [Pseudomonadota bacterium]